jgi:DNA (cytosine-5)-methyltransferase 1
LEVALSPQYARHFKPPATGKKKPKTVGQLLKKEMASRGLKGTDAWGKQANSIAPTLVGGLNETRGPDVGATRAKQASDASG